MLIPGSSLRQSAATAMLLTTTTRSSATNRSFLCSTIPSLTGTSCSGPHTSTALHLASINSSDLFSSTFAVTNYQGATKTLGILAAYSLMANLLYLARRANLRQMTIRELWKIRTTREEGVSRPLFAGMVMAWQMLVLVFPIVEPCARFGSFAVQGRLRFGRKDNNTHMNTNTNTPPPPRNDGETTTTMPPAYPKNTDQPGWAVFFYSYPKAQGGGYILEPLACQHLGGNLRAKQQIRLDWHSFKYNVGPIGRDGFRHPPTMERNLPHIDIPRYQMRHWPWRKHYKIPTTSDDVK
ncbi:MAG: hypothetical protein SGBAC_004944 [Bacillariaceae sp.]